MKTNEFFKIVPALFVMMIILQACPLPNTTSQTLPVTDYRITLEKPWENTLAIIAPGENKDALLGQIVLSGGQNAGHIYTKPLFLAGSPAKLDISANSTIRTLPVGPEYSFGTDNSITKLQDGSLLAMRNGASWAPMNNPPSWAKDSVEGDGIKPGQRGASIFWRSTDGGTTWTKQGMIDFGDEKLRKYGAPRPMDINNNADVDLDKQATMPSNRKRWWIGGGDRPEVYVCPFTKNIWHTTRVIAGINSVNKQDAYLLFLSTDLGESWKLVKEGIPGWESLVMTSAPGGRLFLFQEVGSTPTVYWSKQGFTTNGMIPFSEGYPIYKSINKNSKVVNIEASGPDTVRFDRLGVGTPAVCRARTTAGGNGAILVGYQSRNEWGNQEYQILNVQVTDENEKPLVIPITTIKAEDPKTQSVMHGTFIEPDLQMVPEKSISPRSMFYWIQAPRRAGELFAVKYSLFTAAQFTPAKFLSQNSNGQPRYIGLNMGIGDYMKGAFFWYDNKYNFMAQWAEFDGIHCNVVSVSPK